MTGDGRRGLPRSRPPEVRFWEKVEVRDPDECWPWASPSVRAKGYGVFYDGTRNVTSNSFALRIKLGRPLGEGMQARHTCDNPPCCNPDHLLEGTPAENTADMIERGRHHNQQKTNCSVCDRPLAGDNLVLTPDGRRNCRYCKNVRSLARYHGQVPADR